MDDNVWGSPMTQETTIYEYIIFNIVDFNENERSTSLVATDRSAKNPKYLHHELGRESSLMMIEKMASNLGKMSN